MAPPRYPTCDLHVDNAVAHTVAAYGFAHHHRKRRGGERPCDLELVQGPPQALDVPTLVDQASLSHFAQLVDAIGELVASVLDIDRGIAPRQVPAIDIGNAGQR